MDILFVTSDPALASAVKGTLESARHTVSAASDVDSLTGAWPHGTPMDLVIIDDLSAHDLLDETRRSLSRLMDGKAGDGTGTAVRPRTLLLSTPPRTPKANPDDMPQVRRQTPLPTIRKTGRAKADGQAARPAAPPSSLDGASSVPPPFTRMKRSSSRSRTSNCCLTCTRWNPAEPRTRPRSSTATSCSTRAIGRRSIAAASSRWRCLRANTRHWRR